MTPQEQEELLTQMDGNEPVTLHISRNMASILVGAKTHKPAPITFVFDKSDPVRSSLLHLIWLTADYLGCLHSHAGYDDFGDRDILSSVIVLGSDTGNLETSNDKIIRKNWEKLTDFLIEHQDHPIIERMTESLTFYKDCISDIFVEIPAKTNFNYNPT